MPRKPPPQERQLILANDKRRRYGVRLTFEVLHGEYIGRLEGMSLLLDDGTLAEIQADIMLPTESGKRYQIKAIGYPKARDAEEAGSRIAQALLLASISLDFGLRLRYESYEPSAVFDRTTSVGITGYMHGFSHFEEEAVLEEFFHAHRSPAADQKLLLSMELFAASSLESNDRARFVMAVSALEPLATPADLGEDVGIVIDKLATALSEQSHLSSELQASLRGRLLQLKRESIRQALKRMYKNWLPGEPHSWKKLDTAYALRSELLHEGRPKDLDILLAQEIITISGLLRRIYANALGVRLRAPVAA